MLEKKDKSNWLNVTGIDILDSNKLIISFSQNFYFLLLITLF